MFQGTKKSQFHFSWDMVAKFLYKMCENQYFSCFITTWVSEIPVQQLGSSECYLKETYCYQCLVIFEKNAQTVTNWSGVQYPLNLYPVSPDIGYIICPRLIYFLYSMSGNPHICYIMHIWGETELKTTNQYHLYKEFSSVKFQLTSPLGPTAATPSSSPYSRGGGSWAEAASPDGKP